MNEHVMVGVKLLVVGVVASVAWPLAFLYPLYKLSTSLLQIIHSWELNRRLNPQSLFELAQMLVMLYAVSRLVSILSIYSSVGYSSCLLGVVLLGVSVNPSLIKQSSAVMAPYMTQVDRALEHADVLLNYDKLMHALTTTTASSSSSSSSSFGSTSYLSATTSTTPSVQRSSDPPTQYSARVEELEDETVAPARDGTARATNARDGTARASVPVNSASDVKEDDEDAMMMMEEFNIDHFDGEVIDLTGEDHHPQLHPTTQSHHRNAAGDSSYASSHQYSTNSIRLRKKSSLCS